LRNITTTEGRDDLLKNLDLNINWDTYLDDNNNILDNVTNVINIADL